MVPSTGEMACPMRMGQIARQVGMSRKAPFPRFMTLYHLALASDSRRTASCMRIPQREFFRPASGKHT